MISKSYITQTLEELDKLYNSSTSQKKAIYYSKLALLELCGWIEQSMDNIILHHVNHKLKDEKNKKYLKQIIKKNSGFSYESHFRKMLLDSIGIVSVEKLEKRLKRRIVLSHYIRLLNDLIEIRNKAAHTHLKGITTTYDSPSKTKSYFLQIYQLLTDIEAELKNL